MTITSPTIDWHAVALAELHPLRVDILELLARGGETSPKDIANQLDEDLGVVSYHVKALAARGLVRETRTEPRRGALAHFYVLTDKARLQPATVAPVSRRGGESCAGCGAKLRDDTADGLCGFCQDERTEVAA